MAIVTSNEIISLETACKNLLEMDKVRHVAVISKLGKLVVGQFKPGVRPYLENDQIKMVYMQLMLDLKMRQELDEILGPIDYITSRRKNISIICVPTEHFLVVISTERNVSSSKVVTRAEELFDIINLNGI